MENNLKEQTVFGKILGWFFGVLLCLFIFSVFDKEVGIFGLGLVIIGILLLPPVNMKLRNKYQNFVRNKYGEKYNLFIINFAYASIKFLLSFFIIFVFALMSPSNSSTADKSSQTDISVNNEKKQIVIPDNSNIQSQKQSGKTKVPVEYKNALIKAESYSKVMHMSKKGIYEQLTSEYGEQFSEDAAKYAVDNLKADYNLNALEKAKNYQKTMHMSKQGIYEQLISEYGENFTEQEAKYAVNHLED